MEYGARICLGNDKEAGELTTGELTLGFGSIVELDAFADGKIDRINASKLNIEKKDWANGPERFAAGNQIHRAYSRRSFCSSDGKISYR